MIDTPDGIAFAKAAARRGALSLEIETGLRKRGQTAYSIVKEVYGFRGSRESVLADLTEYIDAELRLRKLSEDEFKFITAETQRQVDHLTEIGKLDQPHFEYVIERGEAGGHITHDQRQAMSDLFYVSIVRSNAEAREPIRTRGANT